MLLFLPDCVTGMSWNCSLLFIKRQVKNAESSNDVGDSTSESNFVKYCCTRQFDLPGPLNARVHVWS